MTMPKTENIEIAYRRFRRILLCKAERNGSMPCGSSVELPIAYVINNITDVDVMFWSKAETACSSKRSIDTTIFQNATFEIDTKECHIGFARLRRLQSVVSGARSSFYQRPSLPQYNQIVVGPSWPKFIKTKWNGNVLQVLLNLLNLNIKKISEIKCDLVYAVPCPQWPEEAAEWVTRKRLNGWPSTEIITKIVGLGCHLVPKPHQSNPDDDTQWRFSFSQAEVLLIQSWTDVQKYIYHLLRLIKGEVLKDSGKASSVLCTYQFKTLMLWACEERAREFWEDENIEASVGELVCLMIEWLTEKWCPNYFVSTNNMFDHLSEDVDLSKEIQSLLYCKEEFLPTLLASVPKAYLISPLCFSVPNEVIEYALLLLNQSYLPQTFYSESLHVLLADSDNFLPTLQVLFNGLQRQLQLTRISPNGNVICQEEVKSVLQYFDSATSKRTATTSNVTERISISTTDLIFRFVQFARHLYGSQACDPSSLFVPNVKDNLSCVTIPNEKSNLSCFTISSSDSKDVKLLSNYLNTKNQSNYSISWINNHIQSILEEADTSCVHCSSDNEFRQNTFNNTIFPNHDEFSSLCITLLLKAMSQDWMSPTFLLGMAYYANFYYRVLKDYRAAAELCKKSSVYMDLLDKSRLRVDTGFMRKPFSVLLTSEWALLFDEYLQTIFGFLVLHRKLSNGSKKVSECKSAAVRICPLEFLKYINFQSVRRLKNHDTKTITSQKIEQSVSYQCNFDDLLIDPFHGQPNSQHISQVLLLTAIRISGILPQRIHCYMFGKPSTQFIVTWPVE